MPRVEPNLCDCFTWLEPRAAARFGQFRLMVSGEQPDDRRISQLLRRRTGSVNVPGGADRRDAGNFWYFRLCDTAPVSTRHSAERTLSRHFAAGARRRLGD